MVKVLVLTGYGINCDEETKFAFDKAGAEAEIVHINDLISKKKKLSDYQILAFPGGFSYGDDTGSGYAMANKIRNHLWPQLEEFVNGNNLVIGICNGFQVLVNLGLLPALNKYGEREVGLIHNDSARYLDRWVDLEFNSENKSPWIKGITKLSVPIAHGEGKFVASQDVLLQLKANEQVSAKYVKGAICDYLGFEANPNGSIEDIASITDKTGKILGLMPHPERAIDVRQMPNYQFEKEKAKRIGKQIDLEGNGMKIFRNAVEYFK